jgi:hypothetical protein
MVEHLLGMKGLNAGSEADRRAKSAVLQALQEIANAHNWTYLYQHTRLNLSEPYSTGTITFQVSAGTYPNQVTLASGTWPAWAEHGILRIAELNYTIDRRVSDSIVTLTSATAPAANIAALTTYTLYRDTYTLPEDFVAGDRAYAEGSWGALEYIPPSGILQATRYSSNSSNAPHWFTILGDPQMPNRLALKLYPYPDTANTIDFIYKRRPRQVTIFDYTAGTVTVDASAGATRTITGSSTAWQAQMLGSVIRVYSSNQAHPTSLVGQYPYVVERNVSVVDSATGITTDDTMDDSYSAVRYRISDPIDIEDGIMMEAFRRCCEKEMDILCQSKEQSRSQALYTQAIIRAKEADSRQFRHGAAGSSGGIYQRLADMPRGSDVS